MTRLALTDLMNAVPMESGTLAGQVVLDVHDDVIALADLERDKEVINKTRASSVCLDEPLSTDRAAGG